MQQTNQFGDYYGDYVRIFDGNSYSKSHLISQLTGTSLPSDTSSVASKLLIVLDAAFNGIFKAKIIFEEAHTDNITNMCTVLNPCNINEGHCHYDGQCHGSLRCGHNNCPQNSDHGKNCCYDYCEQFLDMENGRLDYYFPFPNSYGDMQECSWSIQAPSNHIISLEFVKIDVSVLRIKM